MEYEILEAEDDDGEEDGREHDEDNAAEDDDNEEGSREDDVDNLPR